MIIKACNDLEKFYELNEGDATVEWINNRSMKVPNLGWAFPLVVGLTGGGCKLGDIAPVVEVELLAATTISNSGHALHLQNSRETSCL